MKNSVFEVRRFVCKTSGHIPIRIGIVFGFLNYCHFTMHGSVRLL